MLRRAGHLSLIGATDVGGEHPWLLREHPGIATVLRIEGALVDRPLRIDRAGELRHKLCAAALDGRYRGGSFAVDIGGEATLVALTEADAEGLKARWEAARAGHLEQLGGNQIEGLQPAWAGPAIAGSVARGAGGRVSLHLDPDRRGAGIGDRLVAELGRRGLEVFAPEGCGVDGYYLERGWRALQRTGGAVVLGPPQARADLRQAGSVCLLDPLSRRVMIGRREVAPYAGYWAFPGGTCEAGESRLQAARRELHEETGVAPAGDPLGSRVVHVGSRGGQRAYAVENFVFASFAAPEPRPTAELEARWIELDAALSLRPMAAGTRRVLRALLWFMDHRQWEP